MSKHKASVEELRRRLVEWPREVKNEQLLDLLVCRWMRQLLGARTESADQVLIDLLHGRLGLLAQESSLRSLAFGLMRVAEIDFQADNSPFIEYAWPRNASFATTCFLAGNAPFLRRLLDAGPIPVRQGAPVRWWTTDLILGYAGGTAELSDDYDLRIPHVHDSGLPTSALTHKGRFPDEAVSIAAEIDPGHRDWDMWVESPCAIGDKVRALAVDGRIVLSAGTTFQCMDMPTAPPPRDVIRARYAALRQGVAPQRDVLSARKHRDHLVEALRPCGTHTAQVAIDHCHAYIRQGVPCHRTGGPGVENSPDVSPAQKGLLEAFVFSGNDWAGDLAGDIAELFGAYLKHGHLELDAKLPSCARVPQSKRFEDLGRPPRLLDWTVAEGLLAATKLLLAHGARFDEAGFRLLESTDHHATSAMLALAAQQLLEDRLDTPSANQAAIDPSRAPRPRRAI